MGATKGHWHSKGCHQRALALKKGATKGHWHSKGRHQRSPCFSSNFFDDLFFYSSLNFCQSCPFLLFFNFFVSCPGHIEGNYTTVHCVFCWGKQIFNLKALRVNQDQSKYFITINILYYRHSSRPQQGLEKRDLELGLAFELY
jgi:hypothetical protein